MIKDVNKAGNRGTIFTFEDDISVYLINADTYWFLCDTHLGPKSMECIKNYISMRSKDKEVIVFNSHSDWDHIWGNCAFQGGRVIGHEACRKRMREIGPFELTRLAEYHCGKIELVLPNVTFSDRMTFAEEGIEFIHAPGHTVDSSLCFDRKDSVLFVGDLVEYPIPYLDALDLAVYIKTLEFIKKIPAKVKVSAHSGIVDNELIDRNIAYIDDILNGKPIHPSVYQDCVSVHTFNSNNRLFLEYENRVREKLRDKFDYTFFRNNFGDLKKLDYHELRQALESYVAQL